MWMQREEWKEEEGEEREDETVRKVEVAGG